MCNVVLVDTSSEVVLGSILANSCPKVNLSKGVSDIVLGLMVKDSCTYMIYQGISQYVVVPSQLGKRQLLPPGTHDGVAVLIEMLSVLCAKYMPRCYSEGRGR